MGKRASLSGIAKTLKNTETRKTINTERHKVTFTIPSDLVVSLERGVLKMKDLNSRNRGQVTKSMLVELAVAAALNDLNKNGKASQLYRDTETQLSVSTDMF